MPPEIADFDSLERDIERLAARCAELRHENTELKAQHALLTKACSKLVEKQDVAARQIEALVAHLKELE